MSGKGRQGFARTALPERRTAEHTRLRVPPEGSVDVLLPTFDLLTVQSEDQVVVKVLGDLDLDNAPRLRAVLVDLADQGCVHVTLDLAGMTFIDSTGLCVFISGLKHLRESGGGLALQYPSATAMKVLEITGLSSIFAINEGGPCATDSREDVAQALTA